ncbi:MAG TPA: EthD family reductase [Luteitalea sp.]|nr:EthD family reductase [Luteitalea sp.]
MMNRRGFVVSGVSGLGAMAVQSTGVARAAQATSQTMSLNVLYPQHSGARFDLAYYRATHIPLAMKVMQADKVMLIEGVATDAAAPFAMIAHFQFASPEALKAAISKPEMAEVRADIPKFTDIKPTIMVGRNS